MTAGFPANCNGQEPCWQDKLTRNTKGGVKANIANLVLILTHDPDWAGTLGFDAFTCTALVLKRPPFASFELSDDDAFPAPWDDRFARLTSAWLSRNFSADFRLSDIYGAAHDVARRARFHSVRDWVVSQQWDGAQRVNRWLHVYLGAVDTEYTSEVGRIFLISMQARIWEPGSKVDTALVLEGDQGVKKSSALAILAVRDDWFFESEMTLGTKDAYQNIAGRWLIELSELASLNRANKESIKAFISARVDKYRPPYERNVIAVPRQCVFAGSTNQTEYLPDETGNRRFLTVRCAESGPVVLDKLAADVGQLHAEAHVLYKSGVPWWPSTDLFLRTAAAEADARRVPNRFEEPLKNYLDNPTRSRTLATEGVTVHQLLTDALAFEKSRIDTRACLDIASSLRALGWTKDSRRRGLPGQARRYVWVKARDEDRGDEVGESQGGVDSAPLAQPLQTSPQVGGPHQEALFQPPIPLAHLAHSNSLKVNDSGSSASAPSHLSLRPKVGGQSGPSGPEPLEALFLQDLEELGVHTGSGPS